MLAAARQAARAAAVANPHPPGYGRAVAQKLADQLGRSVPRAREASASSMAVTALLSVGVAAGTGGMAYLALTEDGRAIVRNRWAQLAELGIVREQFEPARETLLPDFPEFPPGQSAPRTLVLDLEDTLCHLEWDSNYGWRAAKRPGVDTFLVRMAQAGYEVVLFTSGIYGFIEPIAFSIDPFNCISHRLYRDSTTFTKEGERVKDLARLNRDLKNVIVIDDDPGEIKWHPENLIAVTPFNDSKRTDDAALLRLIPVLEDIILRDVPDVRVELERLRQIGHGDAVAGFWREQEMRVESKKSQENKGIGAVIRQNQQGVFAKRKN